MAADLRQFDVIVLGAGAAGLMCAAVAGQRGRRVVLLEHNEQPGRKILISGGGRCNFTNLHCGPENFLSKNPHFAKSALALYQPPHFLELVERYGIAWHEKTLGQLFCDGSARAIVEMLLAECAQGGVEVMLNARGIAVERAPSGGFCVVCSQGEFWAESLVVATGGLSIPKLGATGLGYELARQFGLEVIAPQPALAPLVLGGAEAGWTILAGVAAEVEAWAEAATEKYLSGADKKQIRKSLKNKHSAWVRSAGLETHATAGQEAATVSCFAGRRNQWTTKQAAEKLGVSGEIGGKHSSGAKARADSVGFIRGLKPPPPSESSFSAACEAQLDSAASMAPLRPRSGQALKSSPDTICSRDRVLSQPVKSVRFREKMLVTHRGLSGPAVLQASLYWRPGEALVVDFAGGLAAHADLLKELREPGARRDLAALKQALRTALPRRLADYLAETGGPKGWSDAALEACERGLRRWEFHPVGTEGFEKAEVTAGGVDTAGLQARTMEARAVPGLFFIGEVVDVTGQLGGYNFQWAWASGVAAGKSV